MGLEVFYITEHQANYSVPTYFYPLLILKGCSALNMPQLKPLTQETGMYVVLLVYGKAYSIYVHKQIGIPLKTGEILIVSFKTIDLHSHMTLQSALE